jgi:hypothetical protein
VLVIGVKQYFVQASPIKDLPAFCAPREVPFFFGRELLVFVECHFLVFQSEHSTRQSRRSATALKRMVQLRRELIALLDHATAAN